jgi:hypothetical protein
MMNKRIQDLMVTKKTNLNAKLVHLGELRYSKSETISQRKCIPISFVKAISHSTKKASEPQDGHSLRLVIKDTRTKSSD